jgi:oligopeptide/dipeptide ABC transporter ATP-binding protein
MSTSVQAPKAALLHVQNLQVQFATHDGPVYAVNGLSFAMQRGETLGIVGESGSGKSQTALAILGLLAHNGRASGSIAFQGRNLLALSEQELNTVRGSQIAMAFQDPMTALNPVLKVGRQITESLRLHLDMDKSEAKETAIALLRAVKIPEPEQRFKAYPHEMSGGMRQRVVIAIALACGPKLLLADEPTTALDVTVQAQILDLLADQQRERYMGVILVTHDLGVVAGRADHIAVMYAGRIVETAPTAVLFREMQMPYTEALLSAIPKLNQASHTRLSAIGGRPPDLINPPAGCAFSPRCPYAQERCHVEQPPLQESPTTPGHYFACFYPVNSPETQAAKERIAIEQLMATAPTDIRPEGA